MMFTEGPPETYGSRNCHADWLRSKFYELFESVLLMFSSSHLTERIGYRKKIIFMQQFHLLLQLVMG